MKNALKQLFTGIVGFFLAAILFIEPPQPETVTPSTGDQQAANTVIPETTEATSKKSEAKDDTNSEGPRDNKETDIYLRKLVHIVDEPTTNPSHTTWEAIHSLQSLVELGDEAVPGIAWVLDRDHEVDYNWYRQPIDVFGISHRILPRNIKRVHRADVLFPSQNQPKLQYGFPLSLRLGLIQALERIGGPYAEEALLTRVREAKREIELAYSIKALQVVAPDFHTEEIQARIKSVLSAPETIYHTDELELAARRFLVGINTALQNALSIAKKNGGPVNEGIPYKDLDDESKHQLPVVMSSIFDTTRNLELESRSKLETAIDQGLKYLDIEHKDEEVENLPPSPRK